MNDMTVGGESDGNLCRVCGAKASKEVCNMFVVFQHVKLSSMYLQKINKPVVSLCEKKVSSLSNSTKLAICQLW